MSFTTRCPACGTMFKVVPDQLKISDGWVRCGHCSDVFDAMLNLQNEAPLPSAEPASFSPPVSPGSPPTPSAGSSRVVIRRTPIAAPPPPPAAPPPMAVRAAATHYQLPAAPPFGVPPAPSQPAHAMPAAPRDPGWAFVNRPDQDDLTETAAPEAVVGGDDWDSEWLLSPSSISRHREEVARELLAQKEVANQTKRAAQPVDEAFARELKAIAGVTKNLGAPPPPPSSPPPPKVDHNAPAVKVVRHRVEDDANDSPEDSVWPLALPDMEGEDNRHHAEPDEPTFVVQARRDAFWRRPIMRALLLLMAVALSAVLGLQWASFERDQLAARYPALEPMLKQLCAATGCSLAAPRRIEAVAIDSSTLTRKLGQLYSFDLVIKNSEPMAVAMPALELSLTDARDVEIARRVFLPEEMPGTPTTVPANGRLSVSMRLSLAESDLGSMAGYRALVFYP